MDPLLSSLANLGGLGLLGACLFWLHVHHLRAFREELAAERKQCHEDHLRMASDMHGQTERLVDLAEAVRLLAERVK